MLAKKFRFVRHVVKPLVFLGCLIPLGLLIWNYSTDNLSANPLADITHETGTWTLRFLVLTLSITPIKRITGWNSVQQLRRMVGLFAFFYVCLHFATYIYLDKFFDWPEVFKDVTKRPFITVGFTAMLMLLVLAITSPDFMVRWVGGKRWKNIHKMVYLAASFGVVHYYWLVKADTRRPLIYGAIIAFLLSYRLWVFLSHRNSKGPNQKTQTESVEPNPAVPSG
jgi:sulfoxide reductase heme-binding subunit YedZ